MKYSNDLIIVRLVWFGMVWYGLEWFGMVCYGLVWFGMDWYGLVWFSMVWYGGEGGQMTGVFIHVEISVVEYNGL